MYVAKGDVNSHHLIKSTKVVNSQLEIAGSLCGTRLNSIP